MPAILGGGISGLSAAYYALKTSSKKLAAITVYETSNRLGGWIKSEKHDGFVLESGPRTIRPIGVPGQNTLKLVEDLNLTSHVIPILRTDSSAKNRMIYVNNELCLLPNSMGSAFKRMSPFSKPLAAMILRDLFVGRSKQKLSDETIYSFAERRFGKEVADYLISAMICGICAGDAKEISVKFLMKDIFAKEQKWGGVIRGFLLDKLFSKKTDVQAVQSKLGARATDEKWAIYSLDGGLEVLPQTLGATLKENKVEIKHNMECKEIRFDGSNGVVLNMNGTETVTTDYLISSLSSLRLSYLVRNQHPELATELKSIPWVDVGVVNLHYDSDDLLAHDGFGFLVPPSENLPILGVIFDSCCFKVPGQTVLTVMMGGRWFKGNFGPDPSEQELLDVARRHIKSILKIKNKPKTSRVHILKKCIPQYVVGHEDRVNRIRKYVRQNELPLALCGSSYDGVGVNDVILSARRAVEAI